MRILYNNEKKEIVKRLEYYGISELPYLLIESGKDRIRAYSGNLSLKELQELQNFVRVQVIGMYMFATYEDGIRLSLDAIHLLKDQITKNVLEIDSRKAEEWMKGQDIVLSDEDKEKLKYEEKGFKIIKNKNEFIGMGKLIGERIVNYLPKERRNKK